MTFGAAINSGSDIHLLDHIAPLAELLDIPLITTEETNQELALKFYPEVKTRLYLDLESNLGSLAEEFDLLIECKYWRPHLKQLFLDLYRKDMQLVFCPHGQSDKGFNFPLLAPYAFQDSVLLYGDLMVEMLKELQIWPSIRKYAFVGNYRMSHYKKHQAFYDAVADREIFADLSSKKPTLLYAPTWKDADEASSFFDFLPSLLKELPSDWNLLVKIHPLLEQREPGRFYSLSHLVEKRADTKLIVDFPPIYPILARADAYLGDFSSVGYDFLSFNRPLFFLPHPKLQPGRLQKCGKIVQPDEIKTFLPAVLESKFEEKRKKDLYDLAFHSELTGGKIKTVLMSWIAPKAGRAVKS